MPPISNVQVVRFCNETIRPLADAYASLYYAAKRAGAEWTAQGMDALIPNTTDVIVDGSESDGRTQITGANVRGLVTHINGLVTDLEATSNAKLNILLRISVNAR